MKYPLIGMSFVANTAPYSAKTLNADPEVGLCVSCYCVLLHICCMYISLRNLAPTSDLIVQMSPMNTKGMSCVSCIRLSVTHFVFVEVNQYLNSHELQTFVQWSIRWYVNNTHPKVVDLFPRLSHYAWKYWGHFTVDFLCLRYRNRQML